MTGAVHLLNDNVGVPRPAPRGGKPLLEHKGLCWLDPDSLFVRVRTVKARPIDPLCFNEFIARGIRKVTTGITGLWRPSVLSDAAF